MGRDTYASGWGSWGLKLGTDGYEHREPCPGCRHRYPVLPKKPMLRVADGMVWPDFIENSYSSRPWFLSERVAQVLTSRYAGLSVKPIDKVEVVARGLEPPAFRYYDITIERIIPRRFRKQSDASFWCACCYRPLASPAMYKELSPEILYDEWRDEGLAVLQGPFRAVCARFDFLELAREERWTGLMIHAVHRPGEPGKGALPVDIFADVWPPKLWFA